MTNFSPSGAPPSATLTDMDLEQIIESEDRYQVATYAKMPIAVERGEGAWVWTSNGERYLDLYGGHAVCATGHSHPLVAEAIGQQAQRLIFYSNLVHSKLRAEAAEKLVSIAPSLITKAFFCSSGTEANENAMRMARMATGRSGVVTFNGSFHGRTADSISASFLGKYRELGRPNVPGHVQAVFGDIDSVAAAIDDDTAAVMLEPIQSMAGVEESAPEFFSQLRQLCDERGVMLIFDEVQTGMGRTGNWFFAGSELAAGVVPDIISLAKALGSGVPVGACLVSDRVASGIKINDLGTTFGGGMIAMAAVSATIDAIKADNMVENAREIEEHLRASLSGVSGIKRVKGKGCLLGIEFDRPSKAVHEKLLEEKIITGTSSDPNVLRLLPPLCVSKEQIDMFVGVLKK
jgi:acetylornithine/N-succinyldiaminopimelate aminotransferase